MKTEARYSTDWEAVEREYRTGARSLRDIASEFGCTEGAIRKRAKKDGWDRDLSAKIKQKAEALVRKAAVREEVRKSRVTEEREQIQASATMLAEKVLEQREDIRQARAAVQKLWKALESELDCPAELADLGKSMAVDGGTTEALYQAVIGLPQQIKNVKLLADAMKVLIDLERKVLRLDDLPPPNADPLRDLLESLGGRVLGPAREAGEGAL